MGFCVYLNSVSVRVVVTYAMRGSTFFLIARIGFDALRFLRVERYGANWRPFSGVASSASWVVSGLVVYARHAAVLLGRECVVRRCPYGYGSAIARLDALHISLPSMQRSVVDYSHVTGVVQTIPSRFATPMSLTEAWRSSRETTLSRPDCLD